MTPDELKKRIYAAARCFAETHDPQALREVEQLSLKLAELRHLAVLLNALARCREEDMRTGEVDTALGFLENRATIKWPFTQFRCALNTENEEGRWQLLNASLNGIKLAYSIA